MPLTSSQQKQQHQKKSSARCVSLCNLLITGIIALESPLVQASEYKDQKAIADVYSFDNPVTTNKHTLTNNNQYRTKIFLERTKRYYKQYTGEELNESNIMLSHLLNTINASTHKKQYD